MESGRISRRAMLAGAAAVAAWRAGSASAMLDAAGAAPSPAIDALLARMTLEEKAGQLTLMSAAWGGGGAAALNPPSADTRGFDAQLADAVAGRLTGVFNGGGAVMAKRMQQAVMTTSRLRIPLIFAADVIHGYRTIFPLPIAEAASFDPDLAQRTARVAAFEATGAGIDWTFSPSADVARDQRWGRAGEAAGEDPRLTALFAAARVRGFQGRDLRDDDAMMACVKHFAAYGAAEGGLDYNVVDLSERTLRGIYLPPYRAAIDAGALSVMAAFDEIDGIPSAGNARLLTGVLRDRWGFGGITVSDYTGDEEMVAAGYAKDRRDAARIAFLAGVDMSMQSGVYIEHLPGLVRDGLVPVERLDRSVRRVLAVKARLGLFDDPFRRIDVAREASRSRRPTALTLAREAAQRAIVLLKNEGDLLPLPHAGKRIALIGPFAEGAHDLNGTWVIYGDNAESIDLATGIRAALADPAMLSVTAGSGIDQPLDGGIAGAVAAARQADVVLLAIGEGERMSGEAQSRTEIVVPAAQQALADAVAAAGTPVVAILKNGRALALTGAVRDAPAILVTWLLGSQTGHAIADILFGVAGPSGRLPVSFPFSSGQEPCHYDHKPTGRPAPPGPRQPYKAQYRENPNGALYPFGHGLTYGRIAYDDLRLSAPTLAWNRSLEITARVTNHGSHPADELVQLYIHDRVASITRPVRELKAFQRVSLAPGATRTVRFTLARRDLEFIGAMLEPTVEPGQFDLWIAPSAEAEGVHGSFVLTAT